jgi:hypothetical protein
MRSSCRLCRAPSRRAKVKGANMTTIRTVDISDRDYEKIRSPLTTVLILSNDRGNFCPVSTALARSHGS